MKTTNYILIAIFLFYGISYLIRNIRGKHPMSKIVTDGLLSSALIFSQFTPLVSETVKGVWAICFLIILAVKIIIDWKVYKKNK